MSIPGGWSHIKLFDPEVKKICLELRPEMEKKIGTDFKIFIPVVYSYQVVAGTNYMFKVLVNADGDGVCFHALIFQPLPCTGNKPNMTEFQYPKSVDDPLIPLEHLQK
ncbi:cystatin-A-like isoform X2 [Carassius auratus]|uniref:Cystatin-A-like isoform X2 n=1 Tax=Carassius auratus TaxID=7957 RepID=A0A6P6MIH4_CARAU|nr:cystatin-A-like isoform X2 [Carassius auratus]